jgi:hypothetical protein
MELQTNGSQGSGPRLQQKAQAPHTCQGPHPSPKGILPLPAATSWDGGNRPWCIHPVPFSRLPSSHSPGNQTRPIKERDLAAVQGETNSPEGRRGLGRTGSHSDVSEGAREQGSRCWLWPISEDTQRVRGVFCPAVPRSWPGREPSSLPQPGIQSGAPNLLLRHLTLFLRANLRWICPVGVTWSPQQQLHDSWQTQQASVPWLLQTIGTASVHFWVACACILEAV